MLRILMLRVLALILCISSSLIAKENTIPAPSKKLTPKQIVLKIVLPSVATLAVLAYLISISGKKEEIKNTKPHDDPPQQHEPPDNPPHPKKKHNSKLEISELTDTDNQDESVNDKELSNKPSVTSTSTSEHQSQPPLVYALGDHPTQAPKEKRNSFTGLSRPSEQNLPEIHDNCDAPPFLAQTVSREFRKKESPSPTSPTSPTSIPGQASPRPQNHISHVKKENTSPEGMLSPNVLRKIRSADHLPEPEDVRRVKKNSVSISTSQPVLPGAALLRQGAREEAGNQSNKKVNKSFYQQVTSRLRKAESAPHPDELSESFTGAENPEDNSDLDRDNPTPSSPLSPSLNVSYNPSYFSPTPSPPPYLSRTF